MAQQIINIGQVPDDRTGDPIREAFDKCNDNFDELYLAAQRTGWVQIADTTKTVGSPLSLVSGVRTLLSLNADAVIESYAPAGTTAASFYNNTTKKLSGANTGDSFDLRITYTADPATTNTNLTWELDIGGSQGVIFKDTRGLLKGSAADQYVQIIPYYTLGTFQANGGDLYVTASGNCDLYDITLFLVRTSSGA